jgi:hypothetical protein
LLEKYYQKNVQRYWEMTLLLQLFLLQSTSSEFSGGAKLSCASRIVCRAYCKLSKLRPSVVGFGRLGGKGFLKGGLKLPLLEDASSADLFKSTT